MWTQRIRIYKSCLNWQTRWVRGDITVWRNRILKTIENMITGVVWMGMANVAPLSKARIGWRKILIGTALFAESGFLVGAAERSTINYRDRSILGYLWLSKIYGWFVKCVTKKKVRCIGMNMNIIYLFIILIFIPMCRLLVLAFYWNLFRIKIFSKRLGWPLFTRILFSRSIVLTGIFLLSGWIICKGMNCNNIAP